MIQPVAADELLPDATPVRHPDQWSLDCDDQGNERVAVTLFADQLALDDFILSTACQPEYATFFRAAAPEWNQAFRWRSLESGADSAAATALQSVINASFSDADANAQGHDPGGVASLPARWTWLALSGVKLKIVSRGDVEKLPLRNVASLLAVDAWESAYFLDFGNQARSQLRALLENLSHWQFTFDNLSER